MCVAGAGTKGRLESCEIFSNRYGGVDVRDQGDPFIVSSLFRDHSGGVFPPSGEGVRVSRSAHGKATIGADCVFERNAAGGVVREE